MSFEENVKPFITILGYLITASVTGFAAVYIPKLRERIKSNIDSFSRCKKKPLRNYFSDRMNREFDDAIMSCLNATKADRCFVYFYHNHCKISMTHEYVRVGFRRLSKYRQNISLLENGKSLVFLREADSNPLKGVQEIDVSRKKYKDEDEIKRQTGYRQVVYLKRDDMRTESIPSLLMKESNTAHVLLSPIMSKKIGLPYREYRQVDREHELSDKIIGIIGLDYLHNDINILELWKHHAQELANTVESLHGFFEVELMRTNIKKRLGL